MAIARFVQTGITPDEYDQMRERLGIGDAPPAGGVFHAAAVGEDGKIRVFEVWDSREQAEAWGEKVMAVRMEAGFGDGPPSIEYLDVHNIVQRRSDGTNGASDSVARAGPRLRECSRMTPAETGPHKVLEWSSMMCSR